MVLTNGHKYCPHDRFNTLQEFREVGLAPGICDVVEELQRDVSEVK